ncbi:MAG: hypothetical protein Q8O40_17715 [Chloroflexota bacterium]|nr:hypothetical protein [Chloroflexota bacterium]
MKNREGDIRALLGRGGKQLAAIEEEYGRSLRAKSVSADLKIAIKELCENLRSVLDYLAHDIRGKYCLGTKPNAKFYFPILPSGQVYESRMEEWFPGLRESASALWDYLESIQPYHGGQAKWLGVFNDVNNENKHSALVEQTRTEMERIHVTREGLGGVSWDPSSVRFGPGVRVLGTPIDPSTQMPVSDPTLQIKRVIWVDFQFAGTGASALGLLRQATEGVAAIAQKVMCELAR